MNYQEQYDLLRELKGDGFHWIARADDEPINIDVLLDELGHALLKDEHLGMPLVAQEDFDIVSKPEHYNRGRIDLFESWYLTRPFNEVRAILESIAERYMKRMKDNRIQDLEKAIETLERLKELEVRHEQEKAKATD